MELLLDMFYTSGDPHAMCGNCPRFGKLWSCPPYVFDAKLFISQYKTANLLALKISPASDTDATDAFSAKNIEHTLRIFRVLLDPLLLDIESRTPASLALFAGSCILCGENSCARAKGKQCKNPQNMRYSLESLGFNVASMADIMLNIKLDWATPKSPCKYLCLICALLSKSEVDLSEICANLSGEKQL